jgi:hypothetical protein
MAFSIETEKTVRLKDRKIAGIVAFSAFALLIILLCFIGYRISNPALSKPAVSEEMTYVPLDPQMLEQVRQGSQAAGTPAKTSKTETTPLQTEQVLTTQSSSAHVASGNSNITNTHIANNHPSGAKHVNDNPFGTGGINDGKFRGSHIWSTRDDQNEDLKPVEKTARFLVATPNTQDIKSDENCKIVLSVLVDPEGNIVNTPAFVKNGSTTNDMTLINEVIRVVKNQARYNKIDGAKNAKVAMVIRVNAN